MRRQRWQNDLLDKDAPSDSAVINEEEFRKSDAAGNLRPDPNGNLITSVQNFVPNTHCPIIDLDIEHLYVPSRTPGHGHLFINKALSYDAYREVVAVLAKHGIVGQGNLLQLDIRRHSGARLPKDYEERKAHYERYL